VLKTGQTGAWSLVLSCLLAACARDVEPAMNDAGTTTANQTSGQPDERALAHLDAWEQRVRRDTDWAAEPAGQLASGDDPIALLSITPERWLVLLRGRDQMVSLDDKGREGLRVTAPSAPRALARVGSEVWVVGELSATVHRYLVGEHAVGTLPPVDVPDAFGFRSITARGVGELQRIDVLEPTRQELVTIDSSGTVLARTPIASGAVSVERFDHVVVVAAVDGHQLQVFGLSARGVPDPQRVLALKSDGPVWAATALEQPASGPGVHELLLAYSLAEDHPLERTGGSFQFIDSMLRVERVTVRPGAPPVAKRVLEMNLSEHGVVMPKALAFDADETLWVLGSGSGRLCAERLAEAGCRSQRDIAPGGSAMSLVQAAGRVDIAMANPLIDAVVWSDERGERVAAFDAGARDALTRVGEALVFTTLMAPQQKSDGALSRFTCETCHFEGHGDGRVHSTGRGDVHATTKPLFGLGTNVPLFTRALDHNLIGMADNEFRVANANSPQQPWFSVTLDDAPWLRHLGVDQSLTPLQLRQAMVKFFFSFRPHTNPRVRERLSSDFSALEARGATLFEQRCSRCHAARLVGDDKASHVPPERWASLVLSAQGALVWARDGYEKTGIVPYVHEQGARPSSLRRISHKRPYFTNGSSPTLQNVLERAAFSASSFMHASNDPALERFSAGDQSALLAFLLLL
jgi:hypothetical protein